MFRLAASVATSLQKMGNGGERETGVENVAVMKCGNKIYHAYKHSDRVSKNYTVKKIVLLIPLLHLTIVRAGGKCVHVFAPLLSGYCIHNCRKIM